MKYRRFGKTEIRIPAISFGGMRFQQSWNGNDPISAENQKNLEACVHHALELGINHFETARGYGTSEKQLGKVLPSLPRDEIVVQTKVGPEQDVDLFTENFERSLSLLRLDYLDLFAFHGINNDECLENAQRCLEKVEAWRAQGRIRHVGFATHGPTSIIVKAVETGRFDYVNLHWFFIMQDNWPAIEAAHKRDMGVFIISPNEKGGFLHKPSPRLIELTAPLHPMVFNGLFCLSHPEIHTLSCGVTKPNDFDLHMETVERLDEATSLVEPIAERLRAEEERVLGSEWVRTWQEGLPDWTWVPGHINIHSILRLRNLVLAYDMLEYGRMRYNLLGNAGHWFPGTTADDLSSVDLTECLAASPHRAVIPKLLAETHAMLKGEARKRLQQE